MNNGIIEQMQAEITELKAKVAAMEEWKSNGKSASEPTPPVPLAHPQDIRDEIIEKSKRDVADLKNERKYYEVPDREAPTCPFDCIVEFIINKEKRVVVALMRGAGSGMVRGKGIAKCDPSDCFNVHIGKAIALRRALGLEVPSEYLNAPRPTEVRVGDVVRWVPYFSFKVGESHITCVENGRIFGKDSGMNVAKIVDDSRE